MEFEGGKKDSPRRGPREMWATPCEQRGHAATGDMLDSAGEWRGHDKHAVKTKTTNTKKRSHRLLQAGCQGFTYQTLGMS